MDKAKHAKMTFTRRLLGEGLATPEERIARRFHVFGALLAIMGMAGLALLAAQVIMGWRPILGTESPEGLHAIYQVLTSTLFALALPGAAFGLAAGKSRFSGGWIGNAEMRQSFIRYCKLSGALSVVVMFGMVGASDGSALDIFFAVCDGIAFTAVEEIYLAAGLRAFREWDEANDECAAAKAMQVAE